MQRIVGVAALVLAVVALALGFHLLTRLSALERTASFTASPAESSPVAIPNPVSAPPPALDYLPPELRARVQRLKSTAPTPPETQYECLEQIDTLWQWANAYSLTGGPVSSDFLYQLWLRRQAVVKAEPTDALLFRGTTNFILPYVKEFTLKDESPDALGALTIPNPRSLIAGEFASFDIRYAVGRTPISTGGGIVIFVKQPRLQTNRPEAPGYVTATTSSGSAKLTPAEPWKKWPLLQSSGTIQFRVETGALAPGETITIRVGDQSGGSPGIEARHSSVDAYHVEMYLDLFGEGDLIAPHWPTLPIVGEREAAYVNAVVPSIVRAASPFGVLLRFEDRFKNPISGDRPACVLSLEGQFEMPIPTGDGATARVDNVSIESPGVYRLTVASADGRLSATSNPIWVQADPQEYIYWGDTHGHTGLADGMGTADGYFRFGRLFAGLDFLVLSEHDVWMDDWEWKTILDATNGYSEPGVFTTLAGYEWTSPTPDGGHHNVYFTFRHGLRRIPVQEAFDLDALYAGLRAVYDPSQVLIVPHAHMPGDWNKSDTEMERLLEITSGQGTFEYFAHRYLDNGFHLGFIGSSDSHWGHPGYTGTSMDQMGGLAAVWATENRPLPIYDAMRARQTYATTGERIILDARLNGSRAGSEIPATDRVMIEGTVFGTEPVERIDFIKNGEVVHSGSMAPIEIAARSTVRFMFDSESRTFDEGYPRSNPRMPRSWTGSIDVTNARAIAVKVPWYANPDGFRAEIDPEDPSRIVFAVETRGRALGFFVELDEIGGGAAFHISTQASREPANSQWGADRPPADLPAVEFDVALADISLRPFRHEIPVVRNIDSIEVRLFDSSGTRDREFSYADESPAVPGDYYYVRVRQVDGSMAWSSPWFTR